jgi:hypothetical protein
MELFNLAWTRENSSVTSSNLFALVDHFNQISTWVASTILNEERVKERANVMKKFILIAKVKKYF